jgi:hypothetical protein
VNKMASVMENYSKFEVNAVVRLLQAEGQSQSDMHQRLVSVKGRKEGSVWHNKFNVG